jgi:hypothetical protein
MHATSHTWRELIPVCRDPREIPESGRDDWVLKAAYSNTGDAVHIGAELPKRVWKALLKNAQKNPFCWVAQRRFETLTLESFRGPVRPCVGIFVIGSKVAGAYVRLATSQITDAHAMEAPLFVMREEGQ